MDNTARKLEASPSDGEVENFIYETLQAKADSHAHLYHQVQMAYPGICPEQIGRCANNLLARMKKTRPVTLG